MLITNPNYQFMTGDAAWFSRLVELTCYASRAQAKTLGYPVLARISGRDADGVEHVWYDSYPDTYPVPLRCTVYYNDEGDTVHATVEVIARYTGTRWERVKP